MRSKHTKLILWVYIAVLAVVSVTYFAMPRNNLVKTAKPELTIYGNAKAADEEYLAALQENADSGKYKVEKYYFNVQGTEIEIAQSEYKDLVLIERKNEDDNKIEVLRYTSRTVVNSIDLTEKFKAPLITLTNKELNINYTKQDFKYVKFPKDFTITQFIKDVSESENDNSETNFGSIILIRVPKSLNITNSEMYPFVKK